MIAYAIKVSPRAKRVLLKVTLRGLEIVTPPGFDPARAVEVVERRRQWIEEAFARLRARGLDGADPGAPPRRLELRCLDRQVAVDYVSRPGACRLVQLGPDRLLLSGPVETGTWRVPLKEWLRGLARQRLCPWLRELGRELGYSCGRIRVGSQRTRWGSCSASGAISLNLRLLFLPPDLVRYVLIHELCHLERLDHSPDYWRLVRRHAPDAPGLEKRLSRSQAFLPAWLEA